MATRFVMHADRQWRVASRRILSVCNWIEIVELVTHAGLLEWVAGCWNPAGAGSLRYRGRAQGRGRWSGTNPRPRGTRFAGYFAL